MPVRSGSKRRIVAIMAAAAMLPATVAAATRGGAGLRFDQAFATGAAPVHFHTRIAYRARDGVHRIELWRDGAIRLRRDTDRRLMTIATRSRSRSPDFRLDLFDRQRGLHTIVDRTSLYQVGRFTDWDDLAFGMHRPAGRYRLTALSASKAAPAPIAPCDWFSLVSDARETRICWSREQAFPMLMLDGGGKLIWRVTAFDRGLPAPALFRPDGRGYIVNNATQDIAAD